MLPVSLVASFCMWSESCLPECMGVGWGWGLHFYCPVIHSLGSKEFVLFCRLQVVWVSGVVSSLWSLFTCPSFHLSLILGETTVHQSNFHHRGWNHCSQVQLSLVHLMLVKPLWNRGWNHCSPVQLSPLTSPWVKPLFTSPTFTPQPHRGWNHCSPVSQPHREWNHWGSFGALGLSLNFQTVTEVGGCYKSEPTVYTHSISKDWLLNTGKFTVTVFLQIGLLNAVKL